MTCSEPGVRIGTGRSDPPLPYSKELTTCARCSPGNYLIFYLLEADTVHIVHILHGAQDYEALLFPDE